jgi:tetratricopeptide (TPR) repeat protein
MRDGNLYLTQGDCALAQFFFQEALKVEDANAEAMVGKGKALACQGAFSLAITEFQTAIDFNTDNVSAYVQLALAYEDQFLNDPGRYPNRLSDALSTLEIAERISPESAEVLNTKGVIHYQLGDLENAKDSLERAAILALSTDSVLSGPEKSTVTVNLGKAYRDLGELELALQSFRRAVVLDPASASAHNNLGNIYFRLGECNQAEYELGQAVTLNSNSLSAISQLAIALFECGRVEDSIPQFERALQLDGAVFTPPLYTYLSRGYMQQGRFDEAVRRAQQGALLPPESADAFYFLGKAYQARANAGDVDAARRAYERALELNPNFSDAQQALGTLP